MAKLKLAYGKKVDIESSITSGKIPVGTMILTDDTAELLFYNLDGVLCTYQERYKFNSKAEAEAWIVKYNCKGEILSIHEGDECNIYIVDYENNLKKFEQLAPTQVQADWDETDTTSPAYIKNKPDITSGNDRHYVHIQMSASIIWDVIHNLNKYPAVTVVDSSGNLVVSDVHYVDSNRLMLTFSNAFSGKCYCN